MLRYVLLILLIPSLCLGWGGPLTVLDRVSMTGSGSGAGSTNTEIGGADSGTSPSGLDLFQTTQDKCTKITTPAGGITVSHGYWYGNTTDGGSDGTMDMAIFAVSGGAQQGSCSSTNSIVDGSSPAWNEVTWSSPISLSGSTEYWVCAYSSENTDIYTATVTSGQARYGSETCGTLLGTDSTLEALITIANYDAHDLPPLTDDETYYATQSGAGTQDGKSLANAWSIADINDASNWSATQDVNSVDPGDTIYLSGTITSSIIPPSSGTSGNPITYDGYYAGDGPSGAVIDRNASTDSTYGFLIDEKSYITIQDCEITDAGQGIMITGGSTTGSHNIIAQRNKIHDMGYRGIMVRTDSSPADQTSHIDIIDNEIYDCGTAFAGMGIAMQRSDNVDIYHNKIYNNVDGIQTEDSQTINIYKNKIYWASGTVSGPEDGIDIKKRSEYIDIYENELYGLDVYSAITVQMDSRYIDIYRNYLHDNDSPAILIQRGSATYTGQQDMDDFLIYGNIFDTNQAGIEIEDSNYPDGSYVIDGLKAFNNTFISNGNVNTYSGCALWLEAGDNPVVKNNIFYRNVPNTTRYSAGWRNEVYIQSGIIGTTAELDFDYNFYDNENAASLSAVIDRRSGTDYGLNWTEWTGSGEGETYNQEANGTDGSAGLNDVGSDDFSLGVGSNAIGAGVDMGDGYSLFDGMPSFSGDPDTWTFATADPDTVGWDVGAILDN